jgi:hypothetical protein
VEKWLEEELFYLKYIALFGNLLGLFVIYDRSTWSKMEDFRISGHVPHRLVA